MSWADIELFNPAEGGDFAFDSDTAATLRRTGKLDQSVEVKRELALDLRETFKLAGDSTAWLDALVATQSNVDDLRLLACELNLAIACQNGQTGQSGLYVKGTDYRNRYNRRRDRIFRMLVQPSLEAAPAPSERLTMVR